MSTPEILTSRTATRRRSFGVEQAWGAPGARPEARIAGLAVVDHERSSTQRDALEQLGLAADDFAESIFAKSGVERRQLNLEPDFLALNLQGRTIEVEQKLLATAVEAVDQLELDFSEISTVLTSSLYSLGCPTLAHRLVEHYPMSPSTDKYHVTGVGCASAVPLMRLATQTLGRGPSKKVLVVAAESMSSILMPAREGDPRVKTVGSAIFGDGCAAAVIADAECCEGPGILATRVHQIPDTLDAVKLSSDADDSHLDLARELPEIAGAELAALVAEFLAENGLGRGDIQRWMLHPGGRRIVERCRDALALSDEDVAISWRALADHGNVGTPSIFYVMHRTMRERRPRQGEHGLAITVGPGVSVGLMLVEF